MKKIARRKAPTPTLSAEEMADKIEEYETDLFGDAMNAVRELSYRVHAARRSMSDGRWGPIEERMVLLRHALEICVKMHPVLFDCTECDLLFDLTADAPILGGVEYILSEVRSGDLFSEIFDGVERVGLGIFVARESSVYRLARPYELDRPLSRALQEHDEAKTGHYLRVLNGRASRGLVGQEMRTDSDHPPTCPVEFRSAKPREIDCLGAISVIYERGGRATGVELADCLDVSERTVARIVAKLAAMELVESDGGYVPTFEMGRKASQYLAWRGRKVLSGSGEAMA